MIFELQSLGAFSYGIQACVHWRYEKLIDFELQMQVRQHQVLGTHEAV